MEFRAYRAQDEQAVCDFLIALNRSGHRYLHWNWARFEWMAQHPEFDRGSLSSMGLWLDKGRIIGAALYDMYFGEGFCAALPGYEALFPRLLDYAAEHLSDHKGFGLAICDDNRPEIAAAEKAGFVPSAQTETVMGISLNRPFSPAPQPPCRFVSLDQQEHAEDLQWLSWQGFDHGTDREEFERQEVIVPRIRRQFRRELSVAAVDPSGEPVSYCCLWFDDRTDYAYVEPVCTIPSCRGQGLAKAVIFEALNRAKGLGAKKAYVLSDMTFYEKLGFVKEQHFTFYWKETSSS